MNRGHVLWLYGLPSSGKTTLADHLAKIFDIFNVQYQKLDGDMVRTSICKGLGFSYEDRVENIARIAWVAKQLSKAGTNVIVSAITPFIEMRVNNYDKLSPYYLEYYVDCGLETCIKRDVKGLYKKAIDGTISNLTGYNDRFDVPSDLEFMDPNKFKISTQDRSINDSLYDIIMSLDGNQVI